MTYIVALAMCVGIFPACDAVTDTPSGPCPGEDAVELSFRMLTAAPLTGTRADSQGHPEADSEYVEFEDGINVRDFAFFIFVGEGDDARLVVRNANIASSDDPSTMITGSPGAYTVTVKIEKERLDKILGHPLTPGGKDMVRFRFVVFANCYSPQETGVNPDGGGRYDELSGDTYGYTYGEIVASAMRWGFAMSEIYSPISDSDSSLDGLFKGNIPMYGTNDFTVTEEALYASRPDERIYLGEIDLLRALAKVRVTDNIRDKDIYGFPRIEKVEFVGSQSHARQLPYDAASYQNGTQVHTPNIFLSGSPAQVKDGAFSMGYIPQDWVTPATGGVKTWLAYVPEQAIAHVNGNVADGLPMFRITVGTKGGVNDSGEVVAAETEEYYVPMTGYEGQEFAFGANILRNHVYTLSVNDVSLGSPLDLTLSVAEWNESGLNLDYTTEVNVSDLIKWQDGTFAADNDTDGVLVMLPWHDNAPVAAVATFGISTPAGATWTADLLVTEGTQGAFKFLDSEGNEVASVSGIVGELSTIRIVTTDPEPAVRTSARLVVTVRRADGSYVEAPLCGEQDYNNYTIVQNSQL